MTRNEIEEILKRDMPNFNPKEDWAYTQDADTVLITYPYRDLGVRHCFSLPTVTAVISTKEQRVIGFQG